MKQKKWLSALLALAMVIGSIGFVPAKKAQAAEEVVLGVNLIDNPNFADSDLSMWSGSGATIIVGKQEEDILPGVTTYGTVSGREQTFQGFLQDVTGKLVAGETYQVEYFMKLSDDYAKEASSGRKAFFGPYLKLSAGGDNYLNQEYSSCIKGDLSKTVDMDKWVKFSGTFTVPDDVAIDGVVARFQEESSSCKGSYSITGVSIRHMETQEVFIEKDVPNWKDSITGALGENTIAGLAVTAGDLSDKAVFQLLTKHANAFTFGNELKPDYLFNYSNGSCPGKETITFNGVSLEVPKINFTKIDALVDKIVKWNNENPDNKLRVRGHTLLWHAQTPEWFFHEEYDPSKDYVTKEVMRLRMEWYIKTVLEHFNSDSSPYKGLFYGWDVLNEAANDGSSQAFRDDKGGNDKLTDSTHNSKSSWWHIYQSSDYIVDAYTFANKYAPESLELYYNDYGDSSPNKCKNICEILQLIKDHEGPRGEGTRISAFGMQAHYGLGDFNLANFEECARKYLDIVGAVQLTELDMGASKDYDGTKYTKDMEYLRQAIAFKGIFDTLKKLDAEEGYNVSGITFWGVIDTTSWLQKKSDLGGGSDGLRSQCPLLFDGAYKVKPAFWAFVDPEQIAPVKQSYHAIKTDGNSYKDTVEGSFSNATNSATFQAAWNEDGLRIKVKVNEKTKDDADNVTLYVDMDNSQKDGITPQKFVKTRKDGKAQSTGGYEVVFEVPIENIQAGKTIGFDLVVDDNGEKMYYTDFNGNQEKGSKYYSEMTLYPGISLIHKGTVSIDGEIEELWKTAEKVKLEIGDNSSAKAVVRTLWDQEHLYVLAEVTDALLDASAKDPEKQDSLEIYINEDNVSVNEFAMDDRLYRINCENKVTLYGVKAKENTIQSQVKQTENGYIIEASIEWKSVNMVVHNFVGIEFRLNDASKNSLNWADSSKETIVSPAKFGRMKLAVEGEISEETDETAEEQNPSTGEGTDSTSEEKVDGEPGSNGKSMVAVIAALLCGISALSIAASKKKKEEADKKENPAQKAEETQGSEMTQATETSPGSDDAE